jgi:transglutaminase-like putative cysteine protease
VTSVPTPSGAGSLAACWPALTLVEKDSLVDRDALFLARKMRGNVRFADSGTAMPILTVRHVTTYHYKRSVAFGDHRMMLRPRDDKDQKVLESQLEITPGPSHLAWTQDIFGNHVAIARFADRASELRFESTIRVEKAPSGFRTADITELARTYPFTYPAEDGLSHAHFTPPSAHPMLQRWAASFLREDGSADTCELLVGMTQTIRRTFKHAARHEKGTRDPIQTLKLASGSCRDLAMLMVAALRALGIAARFVSGYLHVADDDDDQLTGGNTHAWVQACVPGPGWVDFDPSSGTVGNQNLVRVAVAHKPHEAIPLQGSWIGSASDHLAMKVAVKVTATPDAGIGLAFAPAWDDKAGWGRLPPPQEFCLSKPQEVLDGDSRGLRDFI